MATVSSDKGPAPAITQPVLITAATQALIVEEPGAGAELGALERGADVAVETEEKASFCSVDPEPERLISTHPSPSCLQITLASRSDQ